MNKNDAAFPQLLKEALSLKSLTRTGWVMEGVDAPESVASHSWGVAWLAVILTPPELDREAVLITAIIHDLAEVRVGDITPHCGISQEEKKKMEVEAMSSLLSQLDQGESLLNLWLDFENRRTPEGSFVALLDKLDMGLQADIYGSEKPLKSDDIIRYARSVMPDEWKHFLSAGSVGGE